MQDFNPKESLAAEPDDYEPPETTDDPEPLDEASGSDGYPIPGGGSSVNSRRPHSPAGSC